MALLLALGMLAACGGTGVSVASAQTSGMLPSGTGVFVSDIHFNPLADPTLANRLAQAPPAQWDAIFATSSVTAYSPYGQDTNFPLLQSLLAAMTQRVPNPDIVFVSGDFLVHGFQTKFNAAASDNSPAAYAAFVNATEQYMALKLAQTFPRAQIVPALGNNDSPCGDYAYAGTAFLASFSSAWNGAVNRFGGAPDFQAVFATGGYYSTGFPVDPRGRLVVLDTQPWSARYEDGCGPGGGNLGNVELGWLAGQLADARAQGQRVWLLGHIPPGIDAYSTTHNSSAPACPASIVPFYADAYSSQLYALFAQYHDELAFGIFAHDHMDDYRVASDASGNVLLGVKLIPSVSPIFANNPSFVQFTYDRVAGTITDAQDWYLTNLPSANGTVQGVWSFEYDFDTTYGQGALNASGVAGAVTSILTQPAAQAAFTRYYPSSNPGGGFSTFAAYGCALNHLTVTDYSTCYCGR